MGTHTPAPAGPRQNTPFPVTVSKEKIILLLVKCIFSFSFTIVHLFDLHGENLLFEKSLIHIFAQATVKNSILSILTDFSSDMCLHGQI